MFTNPQAGEVSFWIAFECLEEAHLREFFERMASGLGESCEQLPGGESFERAEGRVGKLGARFACFAILNGSTAGLDRADALVLLDRDERRGQTEAALRRLLAKAGRGTEVPILYAPFGSDPTDTWVDLVSTLKDSYQAGLLIEGNRAAAGRAEVS